MMGGPRVAGVTQKPGPSALLLSGEKEEQREEEEEEKEHGKGNKQEMRKSKAWWWMRRNGRKKSREMRRSGRRKWGGRSDWKVLEKDTLPRFAAVKMRGARCACKPPSQGKPPPDLSPCTHRIATLPRDLLVCPPTNPAPH